MSKILVTGGAGFVGSHLCERLAVDNAVYSLDNYFTGSIENHVDGVTYVNGNTKDIKNLIDFRPDIIFHLGEYSRVEQSFEDIDLVTDYNLRGTLSVLEFARQHNSKLIYAGSSTKFGDLGPNSSPYAFTKATNTQLVQNYGKWFDLDYAITYFYNVYGPREISSGKYSTLIAKFLELHKAGKSLSVTKPGTQERNFTHVDDIVDGLVLVGENGYGDGYGIGSPEKFSVLEIAEMIGGQVKMVPERRGNRMSAELITTKTHELGWSAKKTLANYIKELTINT